MEYKEQRKSSAGRGNTERKVNEKEREKKRETNEFFVFLRLQRWGGIVAAVSGPPVRRPQGGQRSCQSKAQPAGPATPGGGSRNGGGQKLEESPEPSQAGNGGRGFNQAGLVLNLKYINLWMMIYLSGTPFINDL